MRIVNLEDCCEILDSKRIPITAANRTAGEYPYYGANGVQDYVADYIFDDELVLLAEDGGNFNSATKPIAYRVSGKCWVNNHAHVLKPLPNINVDYLCYSLMFYKVGSLVNGATREKLTQAAMRKMQIHLRPMVEQIAIVSTLSKTKSIIEHRRTQLAKLDEFVKCRFVEMFGDTKNNPYGWVSVTVDSVTEEILGGVSVSGEARKIQKGELAVLKVSAVTYGVFKCDEYKVISNDIKLGKFVSPKKGDLLFSRANTKELVGATALVGKDYPHLLLPDKIWKIVVSDKVSPVYLKAYLSEPWIRELMSQVATGTSGSMYNISMEKLRQIPVLLPPIERQDAFASFVHRIDKLRVAVQASLDKTQQLFDSLMQEYFG